MRFARTVLPLIVLTLLLVSCNSAEPEVMSHDDDHSSLALSIEERETEANEVAFVIRDGEEIIREVGVSHTKQMHLVIVREDLQYFSHLHPQMDSEGVWRVAYVPPAGGVYWMYADFVDASGSKHTLRFTKAYPGMPGDDQFTRNPDRTRTVDDYTFTFLPTVSDASLTFAFDIADLQGNPVTVEEYLGAQGHSILLTFAGEFIHTHASNDSKQPTFAVTGIQPGMFYRIFTQFKIDGEVRLVTFDWES